SSRERRAGASLSAAVLPRRARGGAARTRRPRLPERRPARARRRRPGADIPRADPSDAELGPVAKLRERLGVRERVAVLDLDTMHGIADGELGDLAVPRARDVGDLEDLRGDVPRARVAAEPCADLVRKLRVEPSPRLQADEEHDPRVAIEALVDRDAFRDVVDLLDDTVDLGRADPHAAGVQHRVRASVDDHAAAGRELRVVAMTPDAGEALEVRGAELALILIVPETERHRGEGRRAYELALLPEDLSDRKSVM